MAWGTPNRERRVLKAGHSSIAVTLPKPWAEAMNLRPGDSIVFDQNDDGTLFLKPAPVPGLSSGAAPYLVQAHSFDTPGILERLIVGAYRVGHDAIEIRTDLPLVPERVEELLQAARKLLGVSVVAQEPNRVLLQNFIDPSKYGLPQLVQRMKMILVAFVDEIEAVLGRHGRSRHLPTLIEEANKVLALLVRQLVLACRDWSLARRIGSPDPRQLLEWRVVVHSLGEVSELLSSTLTTLSGGRPRASEDEAVLKEFLPELRLRLKASVEVLVRPSLEAACEAFSETARLHDAAGTAAQSLPARARKTGIYEATVALQRSAGCLSLLSEVAIDRAVAAGNETVLVAAA